MGRSRSTSHSRERIILRYRGDNKVDMKDFELQNQAGNALRYKETAPVKRSEDWKSQKVIDQSEPVEAVAPVAPTIIEPKAPEPEVASVQTAEFTQVVTDKKEQQSDLVRDEQRDTTTEKPGDSVNNQFSALMNVL